MRLIVKGWANFQHYKDRAPPWIKLHKGLLDDFEYQCLPLASRALAPMIWLLASESTDGGVEYNIKKLAFRLRTSVDEVEQGINPLIENGFLIVASDVLADCKQDACLETETETETETSFAAQQPEPVEDDPPPDAPPAAAPIKSLKGNVSSRGTRLPEDWVLPKPWGEWALSETSLTAPAVRLEAAKFGDYWRAKAGREAVKLDWQATWRNWVRTAADRAQGSAKSYSNSAETAVFGGAV